MRKERRLLIRGGRIVTAERSFVGDVLIVGQKIAQIGRPIEGSEAEVVDARGLLVLPGLIDAHIHLREPGATHKEDFHSGTCAALAGGVTTVLDMPNNSPPTTTQERVEAKINLAEHKAVCDFGFFLGATADNSPSAGELALALQGIVGLKIYFGSSTGDLLVADFPSQYLHFRSFTSNRPIAVHAEDEEAIRYFERVGKRRPPIGAALAVARALTLAEATGQRLHICHVSTAGELSMIRAAKERGVKVTCEVTPHHLFLDELDGARLGALGKVNPPLRSEGDMAALWANLEVIDDVASDHAPHTLDEKQISPSPPLGVPGLETTLPLLLTAVGEGRLSLNELVRLTSTGPASIFGLRGKGRLEKGYDADLVLVDFEEEYTLGEKILTKCGWTPFAGRRVTGRIKSVFLRGKEVFAEGSPLAEPGFGRLVKTKTGSS